MNNINKVILEGNLTRDAELTYLTSGTAVCKFAIANNVYQGKDKDDYCSYFDIVIWGKMAEGLTKYLTKGKGVFIVTKARQNRWEKDGQHHSKIEFHAEELSFKGGGEKKEGSDPVKKESVTEEPGPFDDDGIPF